jgi:hypothetical protein
MRTCGKVNSRPQLAHLESAKLVAPIRAPRIDLSNAYQAYAPKKIQAADAGSGREYP